MKMMAGLSTVLVVCLLLVGMLLPANYRSAFKKQVQERVEKAIPAEVHAEAARQSLVSAEQNLVSAIKLSEDQLGKLDTYRSELSETEDLKADCSIRLIRAREALQAGGLDQETTALMAGEVAQLKEALDGAVQRANDLREHIRTAQAKHNALVGNCQRTMTLIKAKRSALNESVSQGHLNEADGLVTEAQQIVDNLRHHQFDFGKRSREILAALNSPAPMTVTKGSVSAETLIAEIDRSLQGASLQGAGR